MEGVEAGWNEKLHGLARFLKNVGVQLSHERCERVALETKQDQTLGSNTQKPDFGQCLPDWAQMIARHAISFMTSAETTAVDDRYRMVSPSFSILDVRE